MDIANFPNTYVSSNDQQPQLFLGLAMVVATVEAIVQARLVGGTSSGETLEVAYHGHFVLFVVILWRLATSIS